jgi:hypothetical protein
MLVESFEAAKLVKLGLQIPFQDGDFGVVSEMSAALTTVTVIYEASVPTRPTQPKPCACFLFSGAR